MPVFTFPLAFLALLAAPLLLAIYWLRNRAKERQVSSLMLWLDEKQRWDGGQRLHKLQTPLLFFLELLAILLLATAAAKPLMKSGDTAMPLVVVLDDSFSMLAGTDASSNVRGRAIQAIERELKSNRYEPLRFVLAGETPQLLGETTSIVEQTIRQLQNWKCGSITARLEDAIALAFELGGNRARVLVVTDHAPAQEISDSRLQWWAFGSPEPNLAFTLATRSTRGEEERVLLEIANLSDKSISAVLEMETIAPYDPIQINLAAKESTRITRTLMADNGLPLWAKISDDALSVDNEIVLMPETAKKVRVDLRLNDARLRELVEKAIEASSQAQLDSESPELIITDKPDVQNSDAEAWTLQIINESGANSYLGPFVVDRTNPLAEGLSLGGTVWGAGNGQIPGTPIITAGNIALLTDVERAARHELRLRLNPALSTLQETPNWPILIWNLIAWRAIVAPGLRQSNVLLGGEVQLAVDSDVESVNVIDPLQKTRQLATQGKSLTIKAEIAGQYNISAGKWKYAFAANAISREESDLSSASSGQWGNWANAPSLQWEYHSIVWLLLLLALGVLTVHGWFAWRRPQLSSS